MIFDAFSVVAIVAAAVCLWALWLVVWPEKRHSDILTERAHAKVILTLKSGEAFRGVLREQDARAVVLVNADALGMGERGTDIGVDGELVVLREDVAYLQVL